MKPGIYQLFFCVNSDGNCESWEPGSGASLVRRLDIPSQAPPLLALPVESSYPVRTITGWTPVEDLPNWEELSEMGIEISDGEEKILEDLALPLTGDKLRGWPAWVQGVEYPNCPTCQRKMRLLFQVDSEDNIPYMFGDAGTGHITQCEDHQDQLAFGWACC